MEELRGADQIPEEPRKSPDSLQFGSHLGSVDLTGTDNTRLAYQHSAWSAVATGAARPSFLQARQRIVCDVRGRSHHKLTDLVLNGKWSNLTFECEATFCSLFRCIRNSHDETSNPYPSWVRTSFF
jgi:hypothetical protein